MKFSVITTTLLFAASTVLAFPQQQEPQGQNPPRKGSGDLPAPAPLDPSSSRIVPVPTPSPSPGAPGGDDGANAAIPIKKICSTACDVIPAAVQPFCKFIIDPVGLMTCKVLTEVMEGDSVGELCDMACSAAEVILNEAVKKIPEIAEKGGPDLSKEVPKLLDALNKHA